jgi:hypothetical protein
MLELTVLIIGIIILLSIVYFSNNKSSDIEGFDSFYLSACPSGFKSFYNNDGNIVCCDGEIVGNKCLSDNQCTLNGGSPDMPNCVNVIRGIYAEKAKEYCSSSMPNYYEDKSKSIKGCTSGDLNETLTSPKTPNQPQCIIYNTLKENSLSKDSCYNQKQLDSIPCFGNNCTKELIQPFPGSPVLVAVGFTDTMGIHRMAYTPESLSAFLDVINPQWKNQGTDLSKNISVIPVAKAYYVDKTMSQSDVQF